MSSLLWLRLHLVLASRDFLLNNNWRTDDDYDGTVRLCIGSGGAGGNSYSVEAEAVFSEGIYEGNYNDFPFYQGTPSWAQQLEKSKRLVSASSASSARTSNSQVSIKVQLMAAGASEELSNLPNMRGTGAKTAFTLEDADGTPVNV